MEFFETFHKPSSSYTKQHGTQINHLEGQTSGHFTMNTNPDIFGHPDTLGNLKCLAINKIFFWEWNFLKLGTNLHQFMPKHHAKFYQNQRASF